jgi:hypothetical protein
VTATPEYGFTVVDRFRRKDGGDGSSTSDALTDASAASGGSSGSGHVAAPLRPSQTGAGAEAASWVVPGLAAIPVGKGSEGVAATAAMASSQAALGGERRQDPAWLAASQASASAVFTAVTTSSSSSLSFLASVPSAAPAPARPPPVLPFPDPFDAGRQAPLVDAEQPFAAPVAAPSAAGWGSPASTEWAVVEAEAEAFGGGGGVGGEGGGGGEPLAWYSPPQPFHDDDAASAIPPPLLLPSSPHLMPMPPLSPGLASALAITAAAPSPAAFRGPSSPVLIFEGGDEELMNLFDDDDDDDQQHQG